MLALIQRVTNASVIINDVETAAIGNGMLVLLGVMKDDTLDDAEYLAHRTANLRIFNDSDGVPNINVSDCGGEVLVVSQFTLCADTRKGNRPAFADAAPPELAEKLYLAYIEHLRTSLGNEHVRTGVFRAKMNVALTNAGPYTVLLKSKHDSNH